ncbi:MAG: FkbM family methyltransferase [Lewinellaceae bacterium]|nr:FkbM family methyltransferase [Lewinellaceae bacterium]
MAHQHIALEASAGKKFLLLVSKEFFTEHSIEFVDLMKINIEGEEYPLLETIIKADLQYKIDNIQIQFHPWINGAETKREEIRQALSASHRLTYDFPFVWENWERIQ